MARKTEKKLKNEKCTLQDLEYGEKTEKQGKRDTQTLGYGYGEKPEQCGK